MTLGTLWKPGAPVVLVAEHHEDTREMLHSLLALHGFDVIECDDGEAAMVEAVRACPDVIVLDGTLEHLDGVEVTRQLRHSDGLSNVPIIFTSGYGTPEAARRAYEAGCDAYLLKPVNIQELLTLVERLAADPSRHTAR